MSWEAIDEARFRNLLGRLDLHSQQTGTVIPIPNNLNGYTEIRNLLLEGRPELFDTNNQQVFKCNQPITIIAYGGSALLISLAFLPNREMGVKVFFVAAAILFPLLFLREPRKVKLDSENLIIEYPHKEREIHRAEIKDVRMEREEEYNSCSEVVAVYLTKGRKEVLSKFRVGNIKFAYALIRWAEEKE